MTALVKYESACRALAECKAIDEVKEWVDKAAAMQAYSRMAKDKTLEIDAAEIRIRAERRLGQMLAGQKADAGLSSGARMAGKTTDGSAVVNHDHRPKLSDAGISKDLSSKAQKLAAVPEAEFEAEVGQWRERVQAEGVRVSARLESAGEKQLKRQEPANDSVANQVEEYTELDALRDQVSDLQAALVIANMGDVSEEDKNQAKALIDDLRKHIKTLEATLKAVKVSRDTLQAENAQLLSQVNRQRREIDRATGLRTA